MDSRMRGKDAKQEMAYRILLGLYIVKYGFSLWIPACAGKTQTGIGIKVLFGFSVIPA
jgi:hypothetical protein